MGYVTDGNDGHFTNVKTPTPPVIELPPLQLHAANDALTTREQYARAIEISAERREQGEMVTIDQALRIVRTEPVSRLRRPFRR